MKTQLQLFLNAIFFFTRIPCYKWTDTQKKYADKSITYFSLVGIIVGCFGALIYYGAQFILPIPIAIILSIVATIYLTGAFHEDGFADVCDGFGGGWTKEKILLIMKDSRLGTYGVIGLIFILTLKYSSLATINSEFIPLTIIAGHSISRCAAASLVFTHPYVSNSENNKSGEKASNMTISMLLTNITFGIAPLFLFETPWVFITLIPVYLAKLFLGYKFKKWIGGQTGDCAGATQQLCEIIFYLSLLIVWKFI